MLLPHYYAVAIAAALLTAAWLFKPEARTSVTTLGAFFGWSLTALFGDDTETYADAGANVSTVNGSEYVVPQGDALVAAPVPDEIRLFATFWAVISGAALMLYLWGVYPPADERPIDILLGRT